MAKERDDREGNIIPQTIIISAQGEVIVQGEHAPEFNIVETDSHREVYSPEGVLVGKFPLDKPKEPDDSFESWKSRLSMDSMEFDDEDEEATGDLYSED